MHILSSYLYFNENFYFLTVEAPNTHDLVKREDVQEALSADEGPKAKLISFQMKDFTCKGDNYTCVVSSVKLIFEKDGQEQSTSYVVKLNPLRPMQAMKEMSKLLFEKEIGFYKEIVPLLNTELERLKFTPLKIPKYLHSVLKDGNEVIFLEDMRKRGFKMLDRKIGMDRNHTMLIMKELARLHAISAVLMNTEEFKGDNLLKKFPFLEEAFTKIINDSSNNLMADWLGHAMSTSAEIADRNRGYEFAGEFLRSIIPRINDVLIGILTTEEPFVVICHGDCWNNNFLYR